MSLRFKLNRDTHAVLMDEIRRFKEQPGTQPTDENRRIVEDLTGWPYDRLWGHGAQAHTPGSVPLTIAKEKA